MKQFFFSSSYYTFKNVSNFWFINKSRILYSPWNWFLLRRCDSVFHGAFLYYNKLPLSKYESQIFYILSNLENTAVPLLLFCVNVLSRGYQGRPRSPWTLWWTSGVSWWGSRRSPSNISVTHQKQCKLHEKHHGEVEFCQDSHDSQLTGLRRLKKTRLLATRGLQHC